MSQVFTRYDRIKNMRLHRFIGDFDLSKKQLEIKDSEIIHQITKVLRFKAGDEIILSDGRTNESTALIEKIPAHNASSTAVARPHDSHQRVGQAGGDKKSLIISLLKVYKNENEPKNKVSLYCSILKRENFELVLQKTTECGVFEIIPIITTRTVKTGLNKERMEKIIKEASEQSSRGTVPHLGEIITFEKSLIEAKKFDRKIIFDPSGKNFNPHQDEARENSKIESIAIFIGPEGGFNENEIKLAKENNFEILNLGKLILRAETAVIVSSYLLTN
ncbi:MAG: 16S rRNA (uracil(1498)-N(3))-methyltransferase [Candidatus Paceibacterota bacterium]|jgi:16S rRNA (uracil1498-N3)-methyltransferase